VESWIVSEEAVLVEPLLDLLMGFAVVEMLVLVLVLTGDGDGDIDADADVDEEGGESGKPRPGRQVCVAMMPILRWVGVEPEAEAEDGAGWYSDEGAAGSLLVLWLFLQ
jgi:hypothetical protein